MVNYAMTVELAVNPNSLSSATISNVVLTEG
jgi:hypothetical protein